MSDGQSFTRRIAVTLAGVALVAALGGAVLSIYRRLPEDEHTSSPLARPGQRTTLLRVRLRREGVGFPVSAKKVPVQLFPINMEAARNEYDSELRPGQRFNDFATRLMGGRQRIDAELDEGGEAVIAVPPGRWWIHAEIEGERELAWRLSVDVAGREKTVELTKENAYLRAKRF
ncbi:MAG: hypothetical protein QOH49_641 [Acidobacteriota bacterium]|jgi:hypothetical protein|nr:hypothetical protein [Acidobacteriota bacterium]